MTGFPIDNIFIPWFVSKPEDEQDEPNFEEDGFIEPTGLLGARTSASFGGKHLGDFDSERRALAAIRLEMWREQFWPNVWSISDHGNVHGPISVHGGKR